MFSKALRLADPLLIGGILFSISIGVIMVISRNDTLSGLTIGLLSTLVTLGFDLVVRQAKTEKTLIEAMEMSQIFADEVVRDSLKEIGDSYQIIKSYDYDVFSRVAEASIQECRIKTSELASGSLRFEGTSVQELGSIEYENAKDHIKVMHKNDMDYWISPFGKNYFERNLEALRRKIKITRIFLISDEEAKKYIHILQKQEEAGIEVIIMNPQFVNPGRDFLLFDNKILMHYYTDLQNQYKIEEIIVSPERVKHAIQQFDILMKHPYGKHVKDFL